MIKLDIGSGRAELKGYITVDKDKSVSADCVVDIEEDDVFQKLFCKDILEIRCHHILEHIKTENKVKVMKLFWDLLEEGGVLDIEVPLFPEPESIQDPTHISFWNKESFWYFIKGNNFGEAFAKRYSKYKVPLFSLVSDDLRTNKKNRAWAYKIKLQK